MEPTPRFALDSAKDRLLLRRQMDGRLNAIAELMRPIREEFNNIGSTTEGEARGVRSYDSTAGLALDQAGSSIYSMITALGNNWLSFKLSDERQKRQRANREWLERVNEIMLMSIGPAVSNFYNDSPETILDAIGLGTGCFYTSRQPGSKRFVDKAIPLAEVSFSVDAWGRVRYFDRWFNETYHSMRTMFGDDALPKSMRLDAERYPHRKEPLVHTVYPLAEGGFRSLYMLQNDPHVLARGRYAEMPFFVPRWSVGAGETYGRGRGELALADTQMVNEMSRTSIIAAQKVAEPPIAAHDELAGLVNLDPNFMNYGAIDDNGRQRVAPINLGGNIGITLEMADQRRQSIRDAFYHAMLAMVGSPTPSTLEILKNSEQRDQSMGPNLARIMSEFLAPWAEYRFRMLDRARQLPPPPGDLRIEVEFTSPLAKAASASKAQAVLNSANAIAQISAIDPEARLRFNGDSAVRHVVDGLAAPADILVDDDEFKRRLEATRQKEQLDAMLQQADTGSRAAAALGQAAQSASQSR